jgi:hypothetical protein
MCLFWVYISLERKKCGWHVLQIFFPCFDCRKINNNSLYSCVFVGLYTGLHDLCGAVFEHLAEASCVSEVDDFKRERQWQQQTQPITDKKPVVAAAVAAMLPTSSYVSGTRQRLVRLHAAHALCMEVLLGTGLEMGSHATECWKQVFKYDLTFIAGAFSIHHMAMC